MVSCRHNMLESAPGQCAMRLNVHAKIDAAQTPAYTSTADTRTHPHAATWKLLHPL